MLWNRIAFYSTIYARRPRSATQDKTLSREPLFLEALVLIGIMSSSLDMREKLIEVSERHVDTLMPGYSYVQHIEPGTLGFYLMSFVEPLERDLGRFKSACVNTNVSSVGTGAAYGIEFPLDLERFDALLGFDAAP